MKQYQCSVCREEFTRSNDCLRHQMAYHPSDRLAEKYKCRECHKIFGKKYNLEVHYRTQHRLDKTVEVEDYVYEVPNNGKKSSINFHTHFANFSLIF